jgi:radical SAM/Cys-rich protein
MAHSDQVKKGQKTFPLFEETLERYGCEMSRREISTLQVNVGFLCNLACLHCHVEAGPKRTELMERENVDRLLFLLDATPSIQTVDVTGGSPEMNPHFRYLVEECRKRGKEVIDRLNLTIFYVDGYEWVPEFLAEQDVTVVASLPCYTKENLESQRGKGAFRESIRGLQRLNELGYGLPGSPLPLHLVYNPNGASLPPPQAKLEQDYKKRLQDDFGIEFHSLYTITNMPIRRFLHYLKRSEQYEEYMALLVESFNPKAVDGLMCRDLVSVSWDGKIYDCDFNQMLDLPLGNEASTLWDIDSFSEVQNRKIALGSHCYGCTAGAGSSCGGALT